MGQAASYANSQPNMGKIIHIAPGSKTVQGRDGLAVTKLSHQSSGKEVGSQVRI